MTNATVQDNAIKYSIKIHPEKTPIKGNAMDSGDPDYDARVEKGIRDRLNRGNRWAWCTVEVIAEYESFTNSAYLGCCNFSSKKDFIDSGYYDDMKSEAKDGLIQELKSASIAYAALNDAIA